MEGESEVLACNRSSSGGDPYDTPGSAAYRVSKESSNAAGGQQPKGRAADSHGFGGKVGDDDEVEDEVIDTYDRDSKVDDGDTEDERRRIVRRGVSSSHPPSVSASSAVSSRTAAASEVAIPPPLKPSSYVASETRTSPASIIDSGRRDLGGNVQTLNILRETSSPSHLPEVEDDTSLVLQSSFRAQKLHSASILGLDSPGIQTLSPLRTSPIPPLLSPARDARALQQPQLRQQQLIPGSVQAPYPVHVAQAASHVPVKSASDAAEAENAYSQDDFELEEEEEEWAGKVAEVELHRPTLQVAQAVGGVSSGRSVGGEPPILQRNLPPAAYPGGGGGGAGGAESARGKAAQSIAASASIASSRLAPSQSSSSASSAPPQSLLPASSKSVAQPILVAASSIPVPAPSNRMQISDKEVPASRFDKGHDTDPSASELSAKELFDELIKSE